MNSRMLRRTALCAALAAGAATANNLVITNVTVEGRDGTTALVRFDLSWENSWRHGSGGDPLYFHDAAWVFLKVLPDGRDAWEHVTLAGAGVDPAGFGAGGGTPVELVVPDDRAGLFVRRSADGAGTTAVRRATVVWNFASNGLTRTGKVKVQVFGVEMVHVAGGAFKVGDGLKDKGQLFEGGTGEDPRPFAITNAGAIVCAEEAGKLWGASQSGSASMGGAGTIPAAFPNGYDAFYCMKHEITQGQYADFLNTLTRAQQAARCTAATTVGNYMSATAGGSTSVQDRNTVRLAEDPGDPLPRVYATVTPDRACNYISWADLAAFADWSGLRPMTELEFEKACRGPLEPVAGEYAWGTTFIKAQTGHAPGAADGSGRESAAPSDANCCYNAKMDGPVRAGVFAVPGATRERAGASCWGIMELSGNLWERVVTIGNATGRAFTGGHGDGRLTAAGAADVASWPGTDAAGAGSRGGRWDAGSSRVRVSDRDSAASVNADRYHNHGGRATRSAPSGHAPLTTVRAIGSSTDVRFGGGHFDGWDRDTTAQSAELVPPPRGTAIYMR
jgi:formylglycine-generating enzyme required for sulfatase activity